MFSTLETTWDRSARRGWSTFASFTFQALALSLLLLIPLFSIQGPPRLEWFEALRVPPPLPPTPSPAQQQRVERRNVSNMVGNHLIQPPVIPRDIAILNETAAPPAPNTDQLGVRGSTGSQDGVRGSVGTFVEAVAPPPRPVPTHPISVSHWAEGNLVHRVQPAYPEIARLARIQGPVHLRAIISKTGTIENLTIEDGHPMLVKAAIDAVRQWRYRPYLLNNEPVEIETEITVNFILGGS